MNKFVSKYMLFVSFSSLLVTAAHSSYRLSLEHVAEGGTLAEEAISSVRTAHAFGIQRILTSLYDGHIQKARAVDVKSAISNGIGMGFFFFIITSAYALGTRSRHGCHFTTNSILAFQFGTTLINDGHGELHELPLSASRSLIYNSRKRMLARL